MLVLSKESFGQVFYNQNNRIGNIQLYEPNTAQVAVLQSINENVDFLTLQVGYTPIKYLSFSGGYVFKQNQTKDNFRSKSKGEFSLAVGTYYFMETVKREKSGAKIIPSDIGVLFTANLGYSKTGIDHFLRDDSVLELAYSSIFLQLGMYIKFELGQVGMSYTHNRTIYNKLVISRDYPPVIVREAGRIFENKSVFWPNTVNVEVQIGVKRLRGLGGVKFPGKDFFRSNIISPGNDFLYLGLVVEIFKKEQS